VSILFVAFSVTTSSEPSVLNETSAGPLPAALRGRVEPPSGESFAVASDAKAGDVPVTARV
jgi:hypothetical protein